jgi:chemotaxis protein MotA
MGIVGTVMGLVLVLGNLGGDTSALGHSIATAFIATLYGIGLANLFWLPIANKLKVKMKQEVLARELILTGILSIQAGENPSLIKDKLGAYVEEEIFIEEKK